jgi:membrane protein implicated in regulation of membrane protease activity
MSSFANILSFLSDGDSLMFCWLAALVVFLVIEIITLGLTTIWFAAGALLAFFAAWLGLSWGVQLILFFFVSFALLLFTRPAVQEKLNSSREKTNVNSMIGREGKVLEAIDNFNGKGRIVVGGMEWTARSLEDGVVIPQGSKVQIQQISGVKAIVTQAAEELSQ